MLNSKGSCVKCQDKGMMGCENLQLWENGISYKGKALCKSSYG